MNSSENDFNGVHELQLQEYPMYLRNKVMLSHYPELVTILLTQFFKRLLKNEGVIEDNDDIFRLVHTNNRLKISNVLQMRPEVNLAIDTLVNQHIERLGSDKVGSLFSFIVKTAYPINNE